MKNKIIKNIAILLSIAMLAGCVPGAYIGGITGAMIDHRNPWRGGVIGAAIGAVAGATIYELSNQAAREASLSQRPVRYVAADQSRVYYAIPIQGNAPPNCSLIREDIAVNGVIVQTRTLVMCNGHPQSVPPFQPVTQFQPVPQFQQAPQFQPVPQSQQVPQFQPTMQPQSDSQFQPAPQPQSLPQPQQAPQFQPPLQPQSDSQFQPAPQPQSAPQFQPTPESQQVPQFQPAPTPEAMPPSATPQPAGQPGGGYNYENRYNGY
ncbi:MAG: glycine zipper 2TM domain-containing protein [Desulfuromonadales bacterium]|nr:glycine zipper 2TM domain-containing protein [Desulfuromonadales bacterium]